jgi:hypothetical protein
MVRGSRVRHGLFEYGVSLGEVQPSGEDGTAIVRVRLDDGREIEVPYWELLTLEEAYASANDGRA